MLIVSKKFIKFAKNELLAYTSKTMREVNINPTVNVFCLSQVAFFKNARKVK